MGMIACYNLVASEDINNMQKMRCAEVFDTVEQINEDSPNTCDIDKLWDGLHCLLTGVSASEPICDDLLSESIVGSYMFDDDSEDFISYILPERVKEVSKALNEVDFEAVLSDFSPKEFLQMDIYPNIWFIDKSELESDFTCAFEDLVEFYNYAAENDFGVVVSIY